MQKSNPDLSIVIIESGIEIDVKLEQPRNTLLPMYVRVFDRVTAVKFDNPLAERVVADECDRVGNY